MEEKLSLLLKQLEIKSSDYQFFEGGKLEKIKCNKAKDKYLFIINLQKPLKIDVLNDFCEKLKKHFSSSGKINVCFSALDFSIEELKNHYQYYLKLYSTKEPLLETFISSTLFLNDNVLTVEMGNIAEEMKFNSIKEKLSKKLNDNGFKIEIETKINEEKNEELRKEIELEKTKEMPKPIKKENPIILGDEIKSKIIDISSLTFEMDNVTVDAKIFGKELFESPKSNFKIITLKIYDGTDSMYCKIFSQDKDEFNLLDKSLKVGRFYKIKGYTKNDKYSNEIVLNARSINISSKTEEVRVDNADNKRVELHAHTMMSQMDGVSKVDLKKHYVELVERAMSFGHKAIAITDHNCCQSFPAVFEMVKSYNKGKEEKDKFKALYGTELTLIDDTVDIVLRANDDDLLSSTYVVFDFETTGFNAGGNDSIIEVGAVKICNGEIIDRFSELINPGRKIPLKITEITNITDDMLEGKDDEKTVIKRFSDWYGNLPMVAHNAKFDVSFLKMAYQKYGFGEFENTVIDTLELSRALDNNYARHSLSALVKRYEVPWDETAHHRADYDAEGTALVFHKMMKKLVSQNYEKISDLSRLVSKEEIHKYGRAYHVNLLALNKKGLKNLFKIISLANTKYLYKTPRILRSEIEKHREGILVGSGCYESEIFTLARSKGDEELANLISFYDYVEVQPPEVYNHLIQRADFGNKMELIENLKKIIRVTKEAGKIIVATGDVHHTEPKDKIYREIIVNQKVPGGGRHPLCKKEITEIPSQHFRTTDEMLENFNFLDENEAYEIVVTNTNKIADMAEEIEVIIDTGGIPFAPKIENCTEETTDMVYKKAEETYGFPLPYLIEERIANELYGEEPIKAIKYELDEEGVSKENYDKELYSRLNKVMKGYPRAVKDLMKRVLLKQNPNIDDIEKEINDRLTAIIGANFDVIYLISQKLVKKSNDDGYLVGSRGSVGSSFVATMMGITEVNPLPPHYVCPKCKNTIFELDGKSLGSVYASGYDMPNLNCPKCNEKMNKDGHDMPFATFLGFHADKVPDIDLNFSDLNQAATHEYTKTLFGVDNVYRAGTIGTVADRTAYGFVKGYCEDKGIMMRSAEIERLALGCTGVKRTTGQHPGGIVVIPGYMDVFDFTPYQYPADDVTSAWRTTHFDYHAIDQDVLKLDILGHSAPTKLRMIQDITGDDITKVPLDDKDTMSIFLSPDILGVNSDEILNDTGTLGIPEFGTPFTIGMVKETKPKTFAELTKISGLSHGTDVWNGNAKDLIDNDIVPFSEVIGCRDDIMVYLMYHGLPAIKAFKIMEFVRKGKASKDPETWNEYASLMRENNIEEWFIDSCQKIKYMFPKAHAVAYVISAFRLAYYKVHNPIVYYSAQFSVEYSDFDIDVMIKGYEAVKNKIIEISNKGFNASNKEASILECLKVALEMLARGMKFEPIDINKSDSINFLITENGNLIPPFRSIDGLGDVVAKKIVEEREKRPFMSIEDLQKRGKVSQTLIDKMKSMGILDVMDESNQLSLF